MIYSLLFFMFLRLLQYKLLKKNSFYDREKYRNVLRDPSSSVGKILNNIVFFCVILWVWVIVLETLPNIWSQFHFSFFVVDIIVSLVFALEYVYRFMRSNRKVDFSINIFNIIDLLSFAPFFIGLVFQMFSGFDMLKVLRLLRILRLFEVSSHSPIVLGFLNTIREYRHEYKAIFSIFISLLIIISTFVYYCEFPHNPEFSSIPQTLWWGIVTMTTVWYGDMAPITVWWKLFGTGLILLWPVLVAVIGSITILVFMDVAEAQKQNEVKICTICKTHNPWEANFCFECGNKHFMWEGDHSEEIRGWFFNRIFSKKIK